jgi:hypothetical protein
MSTPEPPRPDTAGSAAGRAQPPAATARSVARLLGGAAALGLLGSLFTQWAFDRSITPNVPLSAWEAYARTDLLLAALALAAGVGAALRDRRGALLGIAAGAVAAVVVLRLSTTGDPGRGGKLALLAAAVIVGTGLARLLAAEDRLAALARRTRPVARAAGRVLGSTWLLAPAIVWFTFPLPTLRPVGGTDGSWVIALHLAAERGLDFGTDVVFTYGPLGYLTVPQLVDGGLAAQGVAYVAIVHLALAFALLCAARRSFPLPVAVVVAAAAAKAMYLNGESSQTAVVVVVLVACVAAVRSEHRGGSAWLALVAAGGAVAAFQALVKLNTGAITGALVLVAVVAAAPAGRRFASLAMLAGSFVVALLALWLAWSQDLGALPHYVANSADVVRGFQEYMYTEAAGRQWEYYGALLVLAVLAETTAASVRPVRRTGSSESGARPGGATPEGMGRSRRIGLALMVALFAFAWFKQGFVRHDGHSIDFFAAVAGAGLAVGWVGRRGFAYAGMATLFVALFAAAAPLPADFHRLATGPEHVRDARAVLADADASMQAYRDDLRAAEELDAGTLELLRGLRAHVFPTEAAIAWAFPELDWDPLPVFQGYTASTDRLDQLNAAALQEEDAPERLLRSTEYSPFENPRAVREVFCRYRELLAGERWQVLARATSRCGPLRSLGSPAGVGTSQPIAVPEPGEGEAILVAVRGMEPSPAETLRALAWKPYDRWLAYDDGRTRRVAIDLAGVPSLLRAAPNVDFAAPFNMDDGATTIAPVVSSEGVLAAGTPQARRFEIEFFAMPVRGPATLAPRLP